MDADKELPVVNRLAKGHLMMKEHELSYQELERRLTAIVQTIPHPMSFVSRDYRYLAVNDAYGSFYEAPIEDIVGRKVADFFGEPVFEETIRPHLDRCLAGETVRYESQFRFPDDSVRWMAMEYHPYRDEKGRVVGVISHGLDITEQRDVEERLKKTLDAATDGIWYWHFPSNQLTFGARYYTMLGYEPDEFPPTFDNWLDLIHPDDRDVALAVAQAYLRTKPDLYQNDFRLRTKEGKYRWIHSRARVVERSAEGEAILMIGNHEDITERKRAEDALRQSEATLRAMFNAAPLAIVMIDRNGRILDANDNHAARFELTRKEMMGMCLWDVTPPSVLLIRKRRVERAFETGRPVSGEDRRGEVWNEYHIHPALWNDRGEVAAVIVTALDVTARRRGEEALAESERQKRLILNATSEMVAYYDLDLRVIWANRASEASVGARPGGLVGSHCYEIWAQKDDACPNCPVVRARDTRTPQETEQETPDGRVWHVRGYPVIDEVGKLVALAEFGQDITERKKAEEEKGRLEKQFLQAQKMESVGRLAGGVAHDFNNMLSVIQGHVDLALMDVDKDHPSYADLQEIQAAAKKSTNIVRQLLAFARKQIIAPEVLDLNDQVADMLKMLRRLIGEDMELIWKPGADVWEVKMDPAQIDQILVNLVVNARDAILDVGQVVIETENVLLDQSYCATHSGSVPGLYVRLMVSDTGCGMDKETLQNIFDPFFTTKEADKGTGLGLATVYGIVKQNNGYIDVHSERGEGTSFEIYLPRHEAEPEDVEPGDAISTGLARGTETVLLVEDNPFVLEMGNRLLSHLGYRVLIANSAAEAVRAAREFSDRIHLLMTDVVMPGMNGRDLADRIQESRPETRCLYMSGYTEDIIARQGVLEEGVHFIQKPFSLDDLSKKVREAIGQ
jgi:two-component system, cell cycle sensor histidine kinase and response regulator CckA